MTRADQIRLLASVTRLPLGEAARLDQLIDQIWASRTLAELGDRDVALYVTIEEERTTVTTHDRELLRVALTKTGHVSADLIEHPAAPGYVHMAVSAGKRQTTLCLAVAGGLIVTPAGEVN